MHFRTLFLIFLLAELVSYTGYFFSTINIAGFFVIVAAALVLSLRRLEYGLYIALVELILGGKGYLFSADIGGTAISLRMGLFVVVMAVWIGKVVSAWFHNPSPGLRPPSPLGRGDGEGILRWWWLFGLAIVWGFIVGLARGNDFGNLFLDANGYFYAAFLFPFVWVLVISGARASGQAEARPHLVEILGTVFFTATTLLALKTLFAVYFFSHASNNFIAANLLDCYRWIRNTGVGEITWLPGNFARVFFQSHVYNVVAFFVLLSYLTTKRSTGLYAPLSGTRGAALLSLNTAVIIISLSRSFWVGVIAGLAVLGWYAVRLHRIKPAVIALAGSMISAILLILIVARFPIPRPSPIDLGSAAQSRLEAGEAGASRWNLLPPLWQAVAKHPILGSGFGTRVTYTSNDPRIREVNPTGEYTTYAFEWGWLYLWLKLGAIGLLFYLMLLLYIGRALFQCVRTNLLCLAGLDGLAALSAINIFTPYLNHPLGFGILTLLTITALYDRLGKVVF